MFMNWQSAPSWLQRSSVQGWHFDRGAKELKAALLKGKYILRDSWQTIYISRKLNEYFNLYNPKKEIGKRWNNGHIFWRRQLSTTKAIQLG